jgi:hypothetical protein
MSSASIEPAISFDRPHSVSECELFTTNKKENFPCPPKASPLKFNNARDDRPSCWRFHYQKGFGIFSLFWSVRVFHL